MRNYMKGTAIALLLSGTALATAGTAGADDGYYGRNNYGNDRASNTIAVQFGDVSMGYRDGYWDNERRWHSWNGDSDYQAYRSEHADRYRDYNHDRDGNAAIGVSFSDVSLGYRDGYWDNERRWHRWNGDNDYQAYRSEHADRYRDYNHDRDGNAVIGVSFNDVSMGYRDGYFDNGQRWHRWNNDGDYRSYRDQHGTTYRDYNHDRNTNNGGVTIGFGNVAFGYRDGYWDNGHRWHHWRNRHDYRGYRDQNGSNYHDMNHNRENNDGWQRQ